MPDISEFARRPSVDQAPHNEWSKAEVTVGPDGGSLTTGTLEAPIDLAADWDGVLRGFGLDPAVFAIVDDTVKMNKWQQSKRLESGDRDTIWLYSYSARFVRKAASLSQLDVAALAKWIGRYRPAKRTVRPDEPASTFVVNLADLQLGKSAGGGTEATVVRILTALERAAHRLAELRKAGRNIERVCVTNMGDPIEGCDGQYASQTFTVDLTQREMLLLAVQIFIKAIDMLGADDFLSVLSNHGEWTRRHGKAITSDSDNADGFLGDLLQTMYEMAGSGPSRWVTPHDEMVVMAELSGVQVAFAHGHKETGKEVDWLHRQSTLLLRQHGAEPRLWVTAHKHHLSIDDFGPWFRLQCPSLDGGSKWYADTSGIWSTAGLLTFLVGTHDPRGWSDLAVL